VRRYDPETGTELLRYPDSEEFIVDLAVSPDDRSVAATTLDGQVQLWELESGRPVLALRTHSGRAASVEFEPDAGALWTAGWDGTTRRVVLTGLDTPAEKLVASAEARWGLSLKEALNAVSRHGSPLP
jgi:WD40 repeat protein